MSDQYPQYQPPEDQPGRPAGEPEPTQRFEGPGAPQPPAGGQQPPQGAWTQDPGYRYQEQQTGQAPYNAPYAGAPSQPMAPPPAGSGQALDAKGFFGALFDFNFESFITPKIIKAVYIAVTVLIGLFAVAALIGALFSGEFGTIVAAIIGIPLFGIVYLALARMTLELYFAVVRLSEDVHDRLPKQ